MEFIYTYRVCIYILDRHDFSLRNVHETKLTFSIFHRTHARLIQIIIETKGFLYRVTSRNITISSCHTIAVISCHRHRRYYYYINVRVVNNEDALISAAQLPLYFVVIPRQAINFFQTSIIFITNL